jgi:hypothetical protein
MTVGTSKSKRLAVMNRAFDEIKRAKERPSSPVKPPATRLSSLRELGAAWGAKGVINGKK